MKLVKGVSSDHELIELAKLLNIHLDNVITIDEVDKIDRNGTYIILLRIDRGVGHWVAYDRGDYFDPFGIGAPLELPAKSYNVHQYQGVKNQYCGIWCILWLYSRQYKKRSLMDGFHDLNNKDFES
jgi:hypothetical protein